MTATIKPQKGILFILCFLPLYFASCKHKSPEPDRGDGNYPPEIAKIFINKCATSGCHNALSYGGAADLELDTWEHLFNGGSNGAAIVAYDTLNSPLLYFINRDSNAGIIAGNLMPPPPDNLPLSKDEYNTIRHWIAMGAPDKNGNIPFASNPDTRQKIYITMQACDMVGVIDAEKKVVMRYIPVGASSSWEIAHCLRVLPDGRYAYVSFTNGGTFQKIETATDKVIESIAMPDLPPGTWNVFNISPDGTKVMVSDWRDDGRIIFINLLTKQMKKLGPGADLVKPHGIASNPTFDTFYVLSQYGNAFYKMDLDGFLKETISVDNDKPVTSTQISTRDPHEILMAPNYSKYFITCQQSNEVRVISRANDSCIKAISVGAYPQEMAISKKYHYLFVSCMYDDIHTGGDAQFRGTIYVLNYDTYEQVGIIRGNFSNPHGLAVDEGRNLLFFASQNVDGPAPHHPSYSGGRNGYYNVYNIATLQPVTNRRYEVLPDPYSMDSRFK
jgi:DNA-binding beta-propeller fold protein YncE